MADSDKKTKRKKSSTAAGGGEESGGSGKSSRKVSTDGEKLKGDVITFYQPPAVPAREEDVLQEIDDKKLRELQEAAPLGSDAFAAASLRYRRCVDYLSSGSYPSIYLAWVALPGAINIAPASTALGVIGTHKPFHHDKAFYLLDLNNDGLIDKEDLRMTYASLGRPDMPEKDLDHMLSEAMCNPLDFDAFVILLGYRTVELDPEETLLDALSSWDADDSGLINEEQIRHDLMTWGDKFTAHEVEMALEDAPVYAKGEKVLIDYVEFCKKLCGLRKKK